jgi:predicted nucleic acid-binding protein
VVVTEHWIIDRSAYVRLHTSPDVEAWLDRINRDPVRVATVTVLEMGLSARSAIHWRAALYEPPAANLPVEDLTPAMETWVVEVQGDRRHHRAVDGAPSQLISWHAALRHSAVNPLSLAS